MSEIDELDLDLDLDSFDNFLEKDKSQQKKRRLDVTKALRKRQISTKAYGFAWYPNLHQYSKGKIHCSCPMCSAKTNGSLNKSKGPTTSRKCRLATTNNRYGKKHWNRSDRRRIDALAFELVDV